MKKILIAILFILMAGGAFAQIKDTTTLRTRINTDIQANGMGQITGPKLNVILNGVLNVLQRQLKVDTIYKINDSTLRVIKVGQSFDLTIGNPSGSAATVNTIADLKTAAASLLPSVNGQSIYHVKGYYHVNDGGGGDFMIMDTTGASAVNGMVVPVNGSKAYVRVVNGNNYNIKWFGGVGGGIATYKIDSAALVDCIAFLKIIPGNKSLHIPSTPQFYGFRGEGIVLPDNIEIYGDGDASEIRNVDPQMGTIQRGVIFYTGTYDPSNNNGIYKAPQYPFSPQAAGNNWVKLFNPNDTLTLYPGKVVIVTARKKFKSAVKQLWRASEIVVEEIWKRNADTIFFKHNLQEDFLPGGISSGSGGIDSTYPRILDVNSGTTTRGVLGVDRVTKNIYIHDLYLSQADYNMVDNIPYDQTKLPVNVIGYGTTYESKFQNLTLKSFGTFGGNLFNYCSIDNIKIIGTKKVFDFGFGSTNNMIHSINWIYYPSNYNDTTGERSFVYFDDDFHHNNVFDINVSGATEKLDFFKIGRGAHNNKIYNWNFNVPQYNDTSTIAQTINSVFNWGEDTGYATHDNFISDITIQLDTIGQWIDYAGVSTNTRVMNNVMQNITFRGKIRNSAGHPAVDLDYAGNIMLKNIYFEDGATFLMRGCDSARLMYIYGPTMYQRLLGSSPIKANFYNVFQSSSLGAPIYLTPSGAAPLNPLKGYFYYDSTANAYFGYDGTSWKRFGSGNTHAYDQALTVGADTWDGTAPTGTRLATYSWTNTDSLTTLFVRIKYATGGVTNTTINITIPADVPLPREGSVFNTTNDNMWADYARVSTTSSFVNGATSNVFMVKTGTGAYKLTVGTSSINAKTLWVRITYPSIK